MTSGLELHEASSVGDYDTLEDYLKSGKYDVNLQDPEWKNKTPLHWAAARGRIFLSFSVSIYTAKNLPVKFGNYCKL